MTEPSTTLTLTATNNEGELQWTHPLPNEDSFHGLLGRDPQCEFSLPWDPFVSRRHCSIELNSASDFESRSITVKTLASTTNPIFFQGEETDQVDLRIGEAFVVGSTVIRLTTIHETVPSSEPTPFRELKFNPHDLDQLQFIDADRKLECLRQLPELIRKSHTKLEQDRLLVQLLLGGLVNAEAVAIVQWSEEHQVTILHAERRHEALETIQPSRRLVMDALVTEQRSIVHIWDNQNDANQDYTVSAEQDWAVCTPIHTGIDHPHGIYITGIQHETPSATSDLALKTDIKFVELAAEIVASLSKLTQLERRQVSFKQFFSAPVLKAIGDELETELLDPKICRITAIFCDVRSFSKRAEAQADDLLKFLEQISDVLDVVTGEILRFGGTIGDFHGDAVLGFWGWPLSRPDDRLKACEAGLAIHEVFEKRLRESTDPDQELKIGIGIAHGEAVAGKIGTKDQVKVTVFGPVVNLASRLEGLTKKLQVPIVIDNELADAIRTSDAEFEGRTRHLCRIQPYGLERVLGVYELLPAFESKGGLTNEQIREYEQAVAEFTRGDWDHAYQMLRKMPPTDRAQDFLSQFITSHQRTAPPDWQGFIDFKDK